MRENEFLTQTPDGRTWRIEVLGSGRIRATDIMSPTGYSEWISAEQAGVTFLRSQAVPPPSTGKKEEQD